ncbi:hypothetical protein GQ53DRAFT_746933 [Thozetella sp. PMI_491]|nr:hypothetical protein GQ53DRAFT_746933 [Thozetella sp. PMI_491]
MIYRAINELLPYVASGLRETKADDVRVRETPKASEPHAHTSLSVSVSPSATGSAAPGAGEGVRLVASEDHRLRKGAAACFGLPAPLKRERGFTLGGDETEKTQHDIETEVDGPTAGWQRAQERLRRQELGPLGARKRSKANLSCCPHSGVLEEESAEQERD